MEVVKAVVFRHNSDVKPLLQTFNKMVNECVEYALKHNISSPMRLEKALCHDFKRRYGLRRTTAYRLVELLVRPSSLGGGSSDGGGR